MIESRPARKVTLIGAGSAVFTRGLVADMIVDGGEWHVALVDIDPHALEVAFRLARKMVALRNAPIHLTKHVDRKEALPDADYVVTTIAAGGRRSWEQDVFIPRKYGIFQPVGDTIMPGGISRALRQIPAMVAIANDVAALAPAAVLFNYSNPMSAICRAVAKATDVDIVGLCHGVKSGERGLARMLDVDPARCEFEAVGMNHLCFFTRFRVDGHDAWPRVREKLRSDSSAKGESLRRSLFLETGAYSVLNDRHLCEFFPQFHRDGSHPDGTLGVDLFSFEQTIKNGDKGYAAMEDQAFDRMPLDASVLDRQVGEHEELVAIFRSLESDQRTRYSVNLPNAGQVPNLPGASAIESPAEVSNSGIFPVPVGAVSPFARAVVEKALATVELAVDAALERHKGKFLQALVADGSVTSMRDARALADELWEANLPYLD